MNALRIFISSPSDVQQERTVAGRVIERLQGKYWSFVRLDDVFWESKVARATAHFQDELLNPGQCDIVIGILWTRLGSPLPEKFRKLTGEAHATGTEWELAQAFSAYEASLAQTGDPLTARPDVVVYRRTEERAGDPADADTQRQREALDAFLEREFFNPDEHHTIKRAITFYVTPDEFEARLQSDLEQLILRRIPALKPGFEPPPISGPPFKDLAHFEFEDSDRFFGRNRAIRELQQRLMERAEEGMPFVLIYGGSGYGKSSLMRAGLAPVVTRPGGALPGMDRWRRVLLQPGKGSGPLCERLARVLLAPPSDYDLAQQKLHEHWPLPGLPELIETTIEPDDAGEKWDAASLARLLADDAKLIYAAAGVARTLDRIGHSLLLQIDQLEEVFTTETVTAAERETFFRAVAALTRTGRVWTVATMRSEYFPRIAETPALATLVKNNGGYILAPPGEQELREIIRFPALAARLDYERATAPRPIAGALSTAEHLDDQILADAAGSPDALPLLEFTLHKLYAALLAPHGRRTGELLRWDDYAALGGLKGAIAHTAEDTFAALPPHVQSACDALFGNLVRVDAGTRDLLTRKRPALADLQAAAPGAGEFLGAFLAARLLVTDEEAGRPVITLAHEALITHWPRLADWVSRHRAILRSRQRLEENTRQWTESGHAKKLLLAEGRLAEAEEVETSGLFRLATEERTLIAQSRQQARKRLRFFQAAAAVFAVFAICAAGAGVIAWQQKQVATTNEAKAHTNEARAIAGLKEASRSDTATAQQRLAEGKWQEAVAYLGRAIRYDPENRNAQIALWLALRHGERDEGTLPAQMLSHQSFVLSASFSPDGTRVVTASYDNTARIWDAKSGQPIGAPLAHQKFVRSASFSPDGTRVVTASYDNTARIWDAKSGQPIGAPLAHQGEVNSASFSPDGSRVVTASGDSTARIWDAKSGQPIGAPLAHQGEVNSASFSPDGSRVVTASGDKTARIWDAKSGQPIGTPLAHQLFVKSASFSPDGSRVITASDDNTARIWDAKSGQPIGAPLAHQLFVTSASFSPDGSRVVTTSEDKTARIWDAKSGQPIGAPLAHQLFVTSASFSPDGSRVVTASGDKTARIWDAKSGQPIGAPLAHQGVVTSASFSPDGSRVVTASFDNTARIWDAKSGQPIGVPLALQKFVRSASFSPDGTRVVTASFDNTARIWDAKSGQPIGTPLAHQLFVTSASFSPDGSRVVTGSGDKTARIWDAKSGQPIGAPLAHQNFVTSASFSPDGTRVVTASYDNTARIWDAKSGQPIGAPLAHQKFVRSASFSPDGSRVVTASDDNTARIWDAKSGQPIGAPLSHQAFVTSASFSPDGSRVATASGDNTARIWDAKSGQPIGAPLAHQGEVNSASFSPDGSRVVTASLDKTARIWDAKSGQPISAPLAHQNFVRSANFSPDGSRVVTASEDKTARIWDAKSGQPIGAPLAHQGGVTSASFSPDGSRVVTVSGDKTARIWDAVTRQVVKADLAESLTAFSGGARLDPELGSLQSLSKAERMHLHEVLTPFFDSSEDWRFATELSLPHDPQSGLVSPRMSVTIREASTRLIGTLQVPLIREAGAIDPDHPVLPFADAFIEAVENDNQPANPDRAGWLCEYGMKHLPVDTSAPDLRLAARFVAEVARTVPAQKTNALLLLDRAAKLAPEDEDTKVLRGSLK